MSDASKRRTPAWVRVLLALSLGLNLAVVGLVVGIAVRFGGGPPPRAAVDFALPYVRSLDPGDRRAIFRTVRQDLTDAPTSRAARRAAYDSVVEALRAQPFDRDALEELVGGQADAAQRMQRAAQAAWLDTVSAMSDAERAAYADRVAEQVARRGKGKPPRN
ncbi:MAG: periplasmic heavy metal sensor [Pseudomonadota bacterium]